MYKLIEKEFQEKANYRNFRMAFAMLIIIFAVIYALLCTYALPQIGFGWTAAIITVILIVFVLLAYIFICCFVHYYEHIDFKFVFKPFTIIEKYKNNLVEQDLKILIEILKNNGISTRPKTLEAIRHYQMLYPRNISTTGNLVSILALTISVLALLFNEYILNSSENLKVVILIMFTVILMYIIFRQLNKEVLNLFGKKALIIRLEESLSEIYMKCLIKK